MSTLELVYDDALYKSTLTLLYLLYTQLTNRFKDEIAHSLQTAAATIRALHFSFFSEQVCDPSST